MGLQDVYDRFIALEAELGLFAERLAGVAWWERIRFDAFNAVLEGTGTYRPAHPRPRPTAARRLARALRVMSRVDRNPYLAGRHEVLFYGHSRRKRLADGRFWDLYCDPIIETFDLDYLYLERPLRYTHLEPARTGHLVHADAFYVLSNIIRPLRAPSPQRGEVERLRSIDEAMNAAFGVSPGISDLVSTAIRDRAGLLPQYRSLLRRVRPGTVFVVPGYGAEDLIEVCRDERIPTIELQHGTATRYHLGYSYEGASTRKELFPDRLFSFGRFWKESVAYPIPEDRIHEVGYPFLEKARRGLAQTERRPQVLFISQGSIGDRLSRFAVDAAGLLPTGWTCLYKLHPSEAVHWRTSYPWLAASNIEVIEGDEPDLYRLLAESSVQVGVYSTAVFEGLAFGCRTFVVDLPGIEYMEPLITDGAVTLVSRPDQIDVETGEVPFEPSRYFRPDWEAGFREAMEAVGSGIRL